jgi:hypothetical protein
MGKSKSKSKAKAQNNTQPTPKGNSQSAPKGNSESTPKPDEPQETAYWVPVDQAWKRIEAAGVDHLLKNPTPLGVTIVNGHMLLFNTFLEDAMIEHDATHDFGRWKLDFKDHIERLLPLVPDVPLLKARKVALFVAGTSSAFYAKFMDDKEVRDAVCAAYDTEGGLNTMAMPSLKAAVHRLEIDKKIDPSVYKPYEY